MKTSNLIRSLTVYLRVFGEKGGGQFLGHKHCPDFSCSFFCLAFFLPFVFFQPENILVNHNCDFEKGLKLADFGSCRGIYSKQPYTEYISTRWYRAPECLLTDGYYGAEMDLWGVGCVFFEITSLYPLFPGTNELDQINRVHQILGTPSEKVMQKHFWLFF